MNMWNEIQKLEGKTLQTLYQKKKFDIIEITENAVIICPHATQTQRRVSRHELEAAYQRLAAIGQLTRTEIMKKYSQFNPAYVAAILAELPNVQPSTDPISLRIGGK
jgi:hypothetical protein